jgi:hypothetical protein
VADSGQRFSRQDLIAAAAAQGTPVKGRLIDDWVALGLLDRPDKRGLGRGKGTTATWDYNRTQMFLVVLKKRQEVSRVKTLCNIPVVTWLHWGPSFASVEQVRRAMKTYAEAGKTASQRAARQTARRVVDQLKGPGIRREDRTALIEAIAKALGGGVVNTEELREAAGRVFDPQETGRVVGPEGAQIRGETWIRNVEANIAGTRALEYMTDEQFQDVRLVHLHHLGMYTVEQPRFAADPEIGDRFEPASLEVQANNACSQLLTVIGFQELAKRPRQQDGTSSGDT